MGAEPVKGLVLIRLLLQDAYHCSRHDPCGSAYDTLALILGLDGVELKVNELTDVANEGKDLPDAAVHG